VYGGLLYTMLPLIEASSDEEFKSDASLDEENPTSEVKIVPVSHSLIPFSELSGARLGLSMFLSSPVILCDW